MFKHMAMWIWPDAVQGESAEQIVARLRSGEPVAAVAAETECRVLGVDCWALSRGCFVLIAWRSVLFGFA